MSISDASTITVLTGSILPTVDDLLFSNDTRARIISLKDDASLDKTSTLTADNITVWQTLSGTGRWLRLNRHDPSWARQIDWNIDPLFGSDENSGLTGSPIRTAAELLRRWGQWADVQNNVSINLLSDLPDADPLRFWVTLPVAPAVAQTTFLIKGTRTQLTTGTLLSYIPLARTATQPRNTITSTVDFSTHINHYIRLTSGAGTGYGAWIQEGNVGTATLTPWTLEPINDTAQPTAAPALQPAGIAVGDSFEILIDSSIGFIPQISFKGGGGLANFSSVIQIKNIRVTQQAGSPTVITGSFIESHGDGIIVDVIQSNMGSIARNSGFMQFINCLAGTGCLYGANNVGGSSRFISGGTRNDGGPGGISISSSATCSFDGDFAITVPLIVGGGSNTVTCFPATCRLANVAFIVTSGDAIKINNSACVEIRNGSYGSHFVYGTSNNYGIRIQSGGKMLYSISKPSINAGLGVGRETTVGGIDKLYVATPFVNLTNLSMLVLEA